MFPEHLKNSVELENITSSYNKLVMHCGHTVPHDMINV